MADDLSRAEWRLVEWGLSREAAKLVAQHRAEMMAEWVKSDPARLKRFTDLLETLREWHREYADA
jgi:hypothetical protein